jgi:alkylmercury lyase
VNIDAITLAARLDSCLADIEWAAGPAAFGVWRATMALLMRGQPACLESIAESLGLAPQRVQETLRGFPDAEYDDDGRIVGLGLTLRPTRHRFEVEGRALFTWCALDTLMFPAILGTAARVESTCFATGEPIRLEVDASGPHEVAPSITVVSLVVPSDASSVRTSFCNEVHFFATRRVAGRWLEGHPEASLVSVGEAYRIGVALAQSRFGGAARCC